MTQVKLKLGDLRKIVKEELTILSEAAKEQADHAAKAAVSSAASKLLGAIDDFKEVATPAALSALTPHIDELVKLLNHMNDTPGAYIVKPKVEPKKVSLKAVKSESKQPHDSNKATCPGCGMVCKPRGRSGNGSRYRYVCPKCETGWET